MQFHQVSAQDKTEADAQSDEFLIELANRIGPLACIWEAPQGLVVPRTYQRFGNFTETCEQFADRQWPVAVRLSGGGIVPQGPGIINMSLAYPVQGKPMDHADQAYLLICRIIQHALSTFGIASHPDAVQESFCDGRFNLAIGAGTNLRKVAGTAQVWRRLPIDGEQHAFTQVVMVHALILAAVDIELVTAMANQFEQCLGSGKHYRSDRAASLLDMCPGTAYSAGSFVKALRTALAHSLDAAPACLLD